MTRPLLLLYQIALRILSYTLCTIYSKTVSLLASYMVSELSCLAS